MFGHVEPYTLSRNEIVGLINLMIKLSNSLEWYSQIVSNEESNNFRRDLVRYAISGLILTFACIFFKILKKEQKAHLKPHQD